MQLNVTLQTPKYSSEKQDIFFFFLMPTYIFFNRFYLSSIFSPAAAEQLHIMEDVQSEKKDEPPTSELSEHSCDDFSPPSDYNTDELSAIEVQEEREAIDNPNGEYPPCCTDSCVTREIGNVSSGDGKDGHGDDQAFISPGIDWLALGFHPSTPAKWSW